MNHPWIKSTEWPLPSAGPPGGPPLHPRVQVVVKEMGGVGVGCPVVGSISTVTA